jgi:ring-1,2-phenylacetyl-CoA epoxidase subunit PaaD
VGLAPITRAAARAADAVVWAVLANVPDPEIPALSVVDLGIVRYVRWPEEHAGTSPHIGITPTYSGCPATDVIRKMIHGALVRAGYEHAVIENVLSPPWTSDWISSEGRRKLRAFGIAPPAEAVSSPKRLFAPLVIACPRCGSRETERLSEFGSTPCKAHYRCTACLEPFDYFKCI